MHWWRRAEGFDIVTRTEVEQRDDDIMRRRRRYLSLMVPCLLLVVFGFYAPAPTPLRVGALLVAAVLPPIAAIVGNARPR
jgi:hypothetical protein